MTTVSKCRRTIVVCVIEPSMKLLPRLFLGSSVHGGREGGMAPARGTEIVAKWFLFLLLGADVTLTATELFIFWPSP